MAPKTHRKGRSFQTPKKQAEFALQRSPKSAAFAPPLVQVLSQYELLRKITKHLSSADIAHLAATDKAVRAYMTDDKRIFKYMRASALCDGKGLEARAKCFGHFGGDVENATVDCVEQEGMPCDECDAIVCNNCRYHVKYYNLPCCLIDEDHYEEHEADFADDFLALVSHCHENRCDDCPAFHSGNFPIESIRAATLAGKPRERRYCEKESCTPAPIASEALNSSQVWEFLMAAEDLELWCQCSLTTRFIHGSWLCIPCFFKAEAEAYTRCSSRNVYIYDKEEQDGKTVVTREFLKTEHLCDCGEVATMPDYLECRWCSSAIRPYHFDQMVVEMTFDRAWA